MLYTETLKFDYSALLIALDTVARLFLHLAMAQFHKSNDDVISHENVVLTFRRKHRSQHVPDIDHPDQPPASSLSGCRQPLLLHCTLLLRVLRNTEFGRGLIVCMAGRDFGLAVADMICFTTPTCLHIILVIFPASRRSL
jgi:hypothetical protein